MNMINSPSKVNNSSIWALGNSHMSPHSSPLLSRLEDSKNGQEQQQAPSDRSNLIDIDQAVSTSKNGNSTIGDLIRDIDNNPNTMNEGLEAISDMQGQDQDDFVIRSPLHKNRKNMMNKSMNVSSPMVVHHQPMNMLPNMSPGSILMNSPPSMPMHQPPPTWINEKSFLESKIVKLSNDLYKAQCEISRLQSLLESKHSKDLQSSPSPTNDMNGHLTSTERPVSPTSTCTASSWSVGFPDSMSGYFSQGNTSEKSSPFDSMSSYGFMTNPAQQLLVSPRKSPSPNPINGTATPGRYNRSNSIGSGETFPTTNLIQSNRLSALATPNRGMPNSSNGLNVSTDPIYQSSMDYSQMSPSRVGNNSMVTPIGMDSSPIMVTPSNSAGSNASRKFNSGTLGSVGSTSPFGTPTAIGSNGRPGGLMFPTPSSTPSPNNLYYNSTIAITPKSASSTGSSSTSSSTPLSDISVGGVSSGVKSSSPIQINTPISSSNTTPVINHNRTGNNTVYLLSGGGVGSIKVYDLSREEFTEAQDNQQQHAKRGYDKHALTEFYLSLKGHSRFVSALHSHQGKICSGSGDNSIRIWNFENGECEHVLAGCEGKVGALCSYYGTLVSGSKDGNSHRIRAWDVEKAECVKCIPAHSDWINVLCASDNTLFSGSGDKKVKVWSGPNFENIMTLENPSFVLSLVYDPVYNILVAGTYDGFIRIWDIRSGTKFVKQIKAHSNGVLSLCYHNGLLCSGSKDQTISIYEPKTWNRESQLIGHTDAVKCLVSYQNKWLCSGSYDRTVKLWNLDNTGRNSYCTIATGFKNYTLTCHTA